MQIVIELVLNISFIGILVYIGYRIFSSYNNTAYLHIAYSAFAIAISYFIYLTPRLINIFSKPKSMKVILGYTLLFKEIIITLFLVYLLYVLNKRYSLKRKTLNYTIYSLAALRIVLLLLPYNNWSGTRSTALIVFALIPFLFSGVLLVLLYRQKSFLADDKTFSFFWILLSLYVFSAVISMFFYSSTYIVYLNLFTVILMYWSLYKDFALEMYRDKKNGL